MPRKWFFTLSETSRVVSLFTKKIIEDRSMTRKATFYPASMLAPYLEYNIYR